MSNSTRRGNETAAPGPLDVKKLQNLFTSSESIVLNGLDDMGQKESEAPLKQSRASTSANREKAEAAGDPLRPALRPQRGAGEGVFSPVSQPNLPSRPLGATGEAASGKSVKAARGEVSERRGKPTKSGVGEPSSTERVVQPASGSVKGASERKLPEKRDSRTPPRQVAEDVAGRSQVKAGSQKVQREMEPARPAIREDAEAGKLDPPPSKSAEDPGRVPVAGGATFGTPAEMRERWGLGSAPGSNRKHLSPGALVACAVLVQTGITLLLAAGLWKAFGSKWLEREVALRVAASGIAPVAAVDPVGGGSGDPGPNAAGLVREEALLVLSALADHALVTGERRFLEEFYRTYNSPGLDRLVYRFAVAKEGTVLAAFRDRPARYSLQVDAVLPDSGKTRESQLSAAELTGIMGDARHTRVERARAAYLLRSTRDYQVVDQLAEVLRDEQDLEVLVNALYAFVAITACEEVEGFNIAGLLEWWTRNRTDLLARTPASAE